MKIKLAEALLRRKELQNKVEILKTLKDKAIYEVKMQRRNISDTVDDITAYVPKLTASQVTAEYDWHARQLRKVDALIQHANWTTELEIDDIVMSDYKEEK